MGSHFLPSILAKLNILLKDQEKYSWDGLADRLQVAPKTLYNWLRYPEKHPMPLGKFMLLCEILGMPPARMFGGATRVFPRLDDPIGAEKYLLELEGNLNPGDIKRIVYPLFSPPLMLDPLIKLYSAKGLYKRFFPGVHFLSDDREENIVAKKRFEEFLEIRSQRRKLFEDSNYIIELILMRNEFESLINGERLFKHFSIDKEDERYRECDILSNRIHCIIDQLEYFISLLTETGWNGYPRIFLRMTSSVLRMQYTLFEGLGINQGYPLALISGNSGLLFTEDLEIVNFLRKEFAWMWDNDSIVYPELKQSGEWIAFFRLVKDHLVHGLDSGKLDNFFVRPSLNKLSTFLDR